MKDRELLLERLERLAIVLDELMPGCAELVRDTIAMLKEQETKTGKWIEKEDYNLETYYDCSVCGESWTTIEGNPWQNGMNYCPHCGAKMV